MAAKVFETNRITTATIYCMYKLENPDCKYTYKEFKKIVGDLNKTIIEECLKGGVYNFMNELGIWAAGKFERKVRINKNNKVSGMKVNFGATKKAKSEGRDVVIYHTETIVPAWYWGKISARLHHMPIDKWRIKPTDGPLGTYRKLYHYVNDNPKAIYKYEDITLYKR